MVCRWQSSAFICSVCFALGCFLLQNNEKQSKVYNMKTKKEYMTVQEVAEQYEVSRTAVYDWIRRGLKYAKRREIGKKEHVVICPEDVDDFLLPGIVETAAKMS